MTAEQTEKDTSTWQAKLNPGAVWSNTGTSNYTAFTQNERRIRSLPLLHQVLLLPSSNISPSCNSASANWFWSAGLSPASFVTSVSWHWLHQLKRDIWAGCHQRIDGIVALGSSWPFLQLFSIWWKEKETGPTPAGLYMGAVSEERHSCTLFFSSWCLSEGRAWRLLSTAATSSAPGSRAADAVYPYTSANKFHGRSSAHKNKGYKGAAVT